MALFPRLDNNVTYQIQLPPSRAPQVWLFLCIWYCQVKTKTWSYQWNSNTPTAALTNWSHMDDENTTTFPFYHNGSSTFSCIPTIQISRRAREASTCGCYPSSHQRRPGALYCGNKLALWSSTTKLIHIYTVSHGACMRIASHEMQSLLF